MSTTSFRKAKLQRKYFRYLKRLALPVYCPIIFPNTTQEENCLFVFKSSCHFFANFIQQNHSKILDLRSRGILRVTLFREI
jgi:hypothetical protein